ncbi:enoyl-CoA hydratase/isomerase family protein [Cryptosporangium minutisporangium]|uniref:Enoyl-CoA hydratase-related protein n=1 Tax=Cryptosporangium minutisporangium TaxID=113569 RepID=A0ABP6SPX1_9ACTN
MSETPGLAVDRDGTILRITLNRPEKRNAIDDTMVAGLIDLIIGAGSDESVRAVLLAGAGEHFCSGADIIARNAGVDGRPRVGSIQRRLPWQAHRLVPVLLETQVPVVCAVRGWAAGIGLSLALAADVTVVADDARLWAPYGARGFTPDGGITWMLPRRIGEVRARRMLLLGERVDGATAAEWGLVDRAVPAADVDAEAAGLSATLADGPTVALGLAKSLLHTGRAASLEAHLRDEAFGMELSSRSEDFREGLAAFREKRSPKFTGR